MSDQPVLLDQPANTTTPQVKVTITVPGHTVTVEAPEPMTAVTQAALDTLSAAAALVTGPERTGPIL